MPMDFRKATDELLATFSHEDLADALDSSVPSVRQARQNTSRKSLQEAPAGLAGRSRQAGCPTGERLRRLAKALERAEQSKQQGVAPDSL